jgi:hypothetical protein
MRRPLCLAVCLSITAFSRALAAEPPTPASAQSEADSKVKAEALDARFRALGYKPITRQGLKLYCHSVQQIGSRIERTVCATPEELVFAIQNSRYVGPAGLIGLSGIKFN